MILIGKRIKNLRNKSKYTQTELAKMVGVTKSTIAAYENDSRLPSFDVLIKMAKIFKVSIDSILLDYTDVILDAHGLNAQQLEILETLIAYFRKSNLIETFYYDFTPEFKKYLVGYIDSNLNNDPKQKYKL